MKNKILLALMTAGLVAFAGIFALAGCEDEDDPKKDPGEIVTPGDDEDLDDKNPPLGGSECKHENVTHKEEKPAECGVAGNSEYWYCTDCKTYFSDEELTKKTTLAAVTQKALEHQFGELISKDKSCTENGIVGHYHCGVCGFDYDETKTQKLDNLTIPAGHEYGELVGASTQACTAGQSVKAHYYCGECDTYFDPEHNIMPAGPYYPAHETQFVPALDDVCFGSHEEYWYCTVCENTFADEDGVVLKEIIEEAGTHENVHHEAAKPATCTQEGNEEYWYCDRCKKYFADEDYEDEIDLEDTVIGIAATAHDYGEDFEYNYDTKQYEKVCKNDASHAKVTQTAGSGDYPYLAKDEASLTAAVALGGYIKVEADIEVSEAVTVNKTADIEMDGHTITSSAQQTFIVNATLTISNGKADGVLGNTFDYYRNEAGAVVYGRVIEVSQNGILTLNNVNIAVEKTAIFGVYTLGNTTVNGGSVIVKQTAIKADAGKLTVKGKENGLVTLKANKGIELIGSEANVSYADITATYTAGGINVFAGATLVVSYSKIVSVYGNGIIGNGTTDPENANYGNGTHITVNYCDIKGYGNAIYHPQTDGVLIVNGGHLEGQNAAIEVRAGTVEVYGAELVGTWEKLVMPITGNGTGDGCSMAGMGFAISQHTTNDDIRVKLENCTVTGKICSIYERDLIDEKARDQIFITLGTGDKANVLNGFIYSENCANIENTADEKGKAYKYINSVEDWIAFAAEHSEATVAVSDDHYVVTCDLDFTDVKGKAVNVYDFSGTIDFDNHTVKGLSIDNTCDPAYYVSGLFEVVHDATIKNLNFEGTFISTRGGGVNHFTRLVTILLSGDNLIENVRVSGSAKYGENNASAVVYMIYPYYQVKDNKTYAGISNEVRLTMKGCTSFVEMYGTGGYNAPFVGSINNGYADENNLGKTYLTFIDCVNEGNITATKQASLLIANPAGVKYITGENGSITVENCQNRGKIYGGTGVNKVLGNNGSLAESINLANKDNVKNSEQGVMEKLMVGKLTVTDNKFVLPTLENATGATLTFSCYAGTVIDGTDFAGMVSRTLDVTGKSEFSALTFVNVDEYEGTYSEIDGMNVTSDGQHYVFGIEESAWITGEVHGKMKSAITVNYTLYDGENILAVYTYTY